MKRERKYYIRVAQPHHINTYITEQSLERYVKEKNLGDKLTLKELSPIQERLLNLHMLFLFFLEQAFKTKLTNQFDKINKCFQQVGFSLLTKEYYCSNLMVILFATLEPSEIKLLRQFYNLEMFYSHLSTGVNLTEEDIQRLIRVLFKLFDTNLGDNKKKRP